MKFIYAFIFVLLLSCNTVKKEYVCGDHPCIDKKEFNEYFSKNLTIEIKAQTNNKNKNEDLVKLNIDSEVIKKKDNKNYKKKEKIRLKNEKKKLKLEKIRLLEEREIQRNEEKNRTEAAKIPQVNKKSEKLKKNKISNNRQQVNKIANKTPVQKKPLVKVIKKNASINSTKSESMKSICDEIKDCDIDKITELLIKKGKKKPFPNITSN